MEMQSCSEQLNIQGANIYFIFSTDTVNDMENAAQIQLDRHNCKAQLGGKNNRHSSSWQINYFVVQV
jgi:hypothetical protein